MRKTTLILWVFILYIIQNIFYPILTISGIVPDLLLGFTVAYGALERKFRNISRVIIICAILSGIGTGRVFSVAMIMVGFAGIAAYLITGYLQFIPRIIRTQTVTAIFAFLMSCAEYFALFGTITYGFVINTAVWHTAYTTIFSIIIYLLIKKSTNTVDNKILLTQERE